MKLFYPRRLPPGAGFVSPGRAYTIKTPSHKKYFAYRIVLSTGKIGEYFGLQGTTWSKPPILRNPSTSKSIGGEKFRVYRDGERTRVVAWRSGRATYWVANTLSETLTEKQLLAIARYAKPLG
jgi:hypothetical protein